MADFEVSGTATIDAEDLIVSLDEVIAKLDEVNEKIARTDEQLDELSGKSIDISVLIDGDDKLEELKLFLDDIESHDYVAKVRVDVVDQDKLDKLYLEILELELYDHEIKLKVDTNGIAEAEVELEALNEQLDENKRKTDAATSSTDKFEFSLGMLAPLLIPASSAVLALIGGVGGLASAFGTMLPPLALAAYGVSQLYQNINTLYTGLNANTQAALMNAETYGQMWSILNKNSAAFKNMSSLMQEAIIYFVTLKQEVSQFEAAIQTNALLVLINGFGLLTTAISLLIDPANEAAGAISNLLADFTNRLSDPTFQTFFDNMDKNIGTLVTEWGTGVINIIEGIVAILNAFMPLSLSMSSGFLNMTQSFDTWAQHLASDPGFKRFISEVETNGPKILDVLGKVVTLMFRLVAAMGESGINVGIFDTLSKALGKLNDVASSHPALAQLAVDLSLVAIAAVKLGPALAPLLAFIATPVGAAVAAVVAIGAAFVYAYDKSAAFRQWVEQNLFPMFKTFIARLQEFKNWAISIWPDIQKAWQMYGKNIEALIVNVFGAILGVIEGAMRIIEGIIDIVLGIIDGNWSLTWKGIQKIFQGVVQIILALTHEFFTEVSNIFQMLWKLLVANAKAAWSEFLGVVSTFTVSIINKVTTTFNDIVSSAVNWGKRLVATVSSWLANVLTFFTSLPGKIVSALGNVGSLLYNAGKSIISGLLSGMMSSAGGVLNWLGGLTSDIVNAKGPPAKDVVLLYNAGQLIMKGLINGLESQYSAVHNSLTGLTNELGNNMSKQLTANVTAKINGSLSGLSGGVGGILGTGLGVRPGGGSNGSQVTFAAGSIQINNPVAEQPGITLTRTMQGISKFGSIQTPTGFQTNP